MEDPNNEDHELRFRFSTIPEDTADLAFDSSTGMLTIIAPAQADTFRVVIFAENTENIAATDTINVESKLAVSNENGGVADVPTGFKLMQNYPNPFNPSTVIKYELSSAATVQLEVFDMLGRKVETLINREQKSAGIHGVTFEAGDLSSGIYIYRLSILDSSGDTGNGIQVLTRKLSLIK